MAAEGIDNGQVFYQGVVSRTPGYGEAVRFMAHKETKGLRLGILFANFCGGNSDLLLAIHGFMEFSLMQKLVREYIQSVEIVER